MLHHVRTLAVLALSLVVAGCWSPVASGPSPAIPSPTATGSGALDHATGATDILLRFDQGGGFVPIDFFASHVPVFTLYGDGIVVYRDLAAEALPAVNGVGPNRPLRMARLTEDQIQATLRMAISEGGLGTARLDYPNDRVADASTATFILNAGGISKKVSVYALGIEPPDSKDAPARAAFGKLASRLANFGQDGTIPTADYVPTGYRGYLLEGVDGNPAKPWPWPDIKPADFVVPADQNGLRLRSKVLTVAQAEAFAITPFLGGFERLGLVIPGDENQYSFTLRPLLPDEVAPPDPAPSDGPPDGAIFIPISSATLGQGGTRLSLTFVGGKPFAKDDPCSKLYTATTRVVKGILEIGVFETTPPPSAPVACDLIGYERHLEVDLGVPFAGSTWRDMADRDGRPIPLPKPG